MEALKVTSTVSFVADELFDMTLTVPEMAVSLASSPALPVVLIPYSSDPALTAPSETSSIVFAPERKSPSSVMETV
jgi:hypothetical protein